jgi:hypothetical protein
MSSVNPSDRSDRQDEVNRLREEYEEKESKSTKRKNREIRANNEQHEAELQAVRDHYEKQLESIRGKHREILNEKDQKFTDEARKIKDLYFESLQRKIDQSNQEKQTIKQTYESQLQSEQKAHESQRENLEQNFKNSIAARERAAEYVSKESSDKLKKGIVERAEKLNEKHDEEIRAIVQDRDRLLTQAQRDVRNARNEYTDRAGKMQTKQQQELNRRDQEILNVKENLERTYGSIMENRDAELREERDAMKSHFREKTENQLAKISQLTQQYADDVNGRAGGQINSAKTEANRAKTDLILNKIASDKRLQLEKDHLTRDFQEKFNDLNKQKDEIFSKANDVARERVYKVVDRSEKLAADSNRRAQMSQENTRMRNKEAIEQAENLHRQQLDHLEGTTDKRIRHLLKDSQLVQAGMAKNQEENIEKLKNIYTERVQTQREAQIESINSLHERMDKKLKKTEVQLAKKHDDAVEFYETKLEELEAKNRRELARQAEVFEAREKNKDKAMKQALESVDMKFKDRMAVQEEDHRKEKERIEKRHQEQLQAVIARMAAAQNGSRKA